MALEGYSDNDATTYKDNDIDSDGDGTVDDTDLVKGNDIDSNGDGTVDNADNVTSTYKGNDIDSNGDGTVDKADNSSQYGGLDPSDGSSGEFLKTDGTSTLWASVIGEGVTYVQSSQPSSPSVGETWLDTDDSLIQIYADRGNGNEWFPWKNEATQNFSDGDAFSSYPIQSQDVSIKFSGLTGVSLLTSGNVTVNGTGTATVFNGTLSGQSYIVIGSVRSTGTDNGIGFGQTDQTSTQTVGNADLMWNYDRNGSTNDVRIHIGNGGSQQNVQYAFWEVNP